jgi:hypothetical protein
VPKYGYYFAKTGNAYETPVPFQHTDLKSDGEGIKLLLIKTEDVKNW